MATLLIDKEEKEEKEKENKFANDSSGPHIEGTKEAKQQKAGESHK
jgi:hypothetical protein